MKNEFTEKRDGLLDPIDRISEILFGLIMAVTIVGSLSIATAGDNQVRTILTAALGCNLAWGLVDAVMYLIRALTERTRNRTLTKRVRDADADTGRGLIGASLPPEVAAIIGADELEGMRCRLVAMPELPSPHLGREDYLAAVGIFLLVVVATFPVVVPFLATDNAALAMELSRLVTLVLLFVAGFALGRYAGYPHPARTGLLMLMLGVALIGAVKALGG